MGAPIPTIHPIPAHPRRICYYCRMERRADEQRCSNCGGAQWIRKPIGPS